MAFFGLTGRDLEVRESRRSIERDPFNNMWYCTDGRRFFTRREALAYQVNLNDVISWVGWRPMWAVHMGWMSEQIADRMLGMEGNLQADRFGHVQMDTTTTNTTNTTTTLTPGPSQVVDVNPEMQNMRFEFANHFIETSEQKHFPEAEVARIAEDIRSGRNDNQVMQHFERVRSGTLQTTQQHPQPPQQQPQPPQQQPQQPQPPQQAPYQPPAPQTPYQPPAQTPYQPPVATPAPQQTFTQTPGYQQFVPSMYISQQHATTTTTATTSTSSQQQTYGAQDPGVGYGYASPMPQHQHLQAPQAPLQVTQGPHDPSTIANFNQPGAAQQNPGTPQPATAYGQQ
ncbi:hypothetical protein LTR56_013228 [Elasticomyces elasticus]|nr:hypothetical protein LTR56_013228 [Elasticomyces elasticus]KAK3650085.1 hypothetical protein LTR22_012680 [Elasticomyces elasticus]KAK5757197.1 hypothetical protein LTS12_012713 [Elasticomyces elasticus]